MSALHMPAPQAIWTFFAGAAVVVAAGPGATGVAVTALFLLFARSGGGADGAGGAGSAAEAATGAEEGAALAAAVAVAVAVASDGGADAAADGAAAAAAAAGGSALTVARSALLQPVDALVPRTARAATNVSKVSEGLRIRPSYRAATALRNAPAWHFAPRVEVRALHFARVIP